jgi:hypothetical protein
MCGQCHTPRDGAGGPDRSRWLQDAQVWLVSGETRGRLSASGAANGSHATRQRRRTGHRPHHRNLVRREASASTHAPISHDPKTPLQWWLT